MFLFKKGHRIYVIVCRNVTKEFKKLALIATQKVFISKWQRDMGQLEGCLFAQYSSYFPCEIGKPDKYVYLPKVFYWKTKLIILFGWVCWPEFHQWLEWSLSLKLLTDRYPQKVRSMTTENTSWGNLSLSMIFFKTLHKYFPMKQMFK